MIYTKTIRLKKCKTYGCRNLHRNPSGYCDACHARYLERHPEIKKRSDEKRGSSQSRGYDWRWRTFASEFLKEHPVCAICGKPSTCVDHKEETAEMMMDAYGRFDLDPEKYQALCTRCNSIKGKTEDKAKWAQYAEGKAFVEAETPGGGVKNH